MQPSRHKLSAQEAAILFRQINAYAADFFAQAISRTLDALETEFMIKSDNGLSSRGNLASISKAISIKKHKSEIIAAFQQTFSDSFSGKCNMSNTDDETELSLLDETQIQENLLIDNLAYRLKDQYQNSLLTLTKGLVRLGRRLHHKPEPEAFNPAQLAFIFQKALAPLNLPFAHKPLAYNNLYHSLLNKLSDLYAGPLALLVHTGILEPKDNPLETAPSLIAPYLKVEYAADHILNLEQQDDPNDYTISDLTASDGTLDIELAKLIGSGTKQKHGNPVPALLFPQHLQSDEAHHRLLTQILSYPQTETVITTGACVQPPELLQLLSKLQADQAQRGYSHGSRTLSKQINATLKALKSALKRQVSDVEYNTIQIIHHIFIALTEDTLLPYVARQQLTKLHIAYIKASLLDATLFVETQHPARLLLDEIALFTVGATHTQDIEIKHTAAAVEYLAHHFKNDLDVFKRSYKKLRKLRKKFWSDIEQKTERHLSTTQKKATALHHKHIVKNYLRHLLRGYQLPLSLHKLTLEGFAQIMTRRCTLYGEHSPEFIDSLTLFRNIIFSVQADNASISNNLMEKIPSLLAKARNMLKEVYSPTKVNELLEDLESFYLEHAQRYKERLDSENIEQIDETHDLNFQAPLTLPPELYEMQPGAQAIMPDCIQTGAWFDVYTLNKPETRRLQLAAIVDDTAQLIFFNNRISQSVIKRIATFTDEILCERSRRINSTHLFDKALAIALTNLQTASNSSL